MTSDLPSPSLSMGAGRGRGDGPEGSGLAATSPPPGLLDTVQFTADGLVPAIAQQHDTGEILMMAWMTREALDLTLSTGQVVYWSRSRNAFWRKGETSGQAQRLVSAQLDCDGDTILLQVDQSGVACHTGRRSCFYRTAGADGWAITEPVQVPPEQLYGKG